VRIASRTTHSKQTNHSQNIFYLDKPSRAHIEKLNMEEGRHKKQRTLRTRLRDSFGNPSLPQIHVPLDIWKHILQTTDIQSMSHMAQTSTAFEEIVREKIRTNNWGLALQYRKEGQIRLALWCLKSCVKHGHPHATFHLAYAYTYGGWGVDVYPKKATKYWERAIELGSEHALVLSKTLPKTYNYNTTNPFILGQIHLLDASGSTALAIQYLEQAAAQEGDEFAQYALGRQFRLGLLVPKDPYKAVEWYTKSAEQGLASAQYILWNYYNSKGNKELHKKWSTRYNAQRPPSWKY
jgi:TPR repeat protein